MTIKTVLLLLAAVGAAGSTGLYAKNYLDQERAEIMAQAPRPSATKKAAETQILVIAENLPIGTFIKASHLRWQPWPEDGAVDGYIKKGSRKIEDFVGGVVRLTVAPGQPFSANLIVKPGERGFLAAVLKPGMRATSVPINATSGIAGFVFPGDHVDLILTTRLQTDLASQAGCSVALRKRPTISARPCWKNPSAGN